MSDKTSIEIQFNNKTGSYKTGEHVSGTVNILAHKNFNCRKITVELIWMVHGRGNTDQKTIDCIEKAGVDFPAGSSQCISFDFVLPVTPVTYHGNLLNIDYYIKVKMDVPWAFDPVKSQEIQLLPGGIAGYKPYDYMDKSLSPQNILQNSMIVKVIIVSILAIIILAIWWLAALIGLIFLIGKMMKRFAEGQIGKVKIECNENNIYPGSRQKINLRFTPKKSITLNGIYAELIAEECVTSGSGKNSHTYTHNIIKQKLDYPSDLSCHARIEKFISFDLTIPDTTAFSFHSSSNKVFWKVNFHIDIPNCPDWKETKILNLIPGPNTVTAKDKNS